MFKLAVRTAILTAILLKGTAMATASPTSGQPITLGSGNQLAALAQLLPQIFGNKQTTTGNPGDTSALQALISQLQGADYSKTLEALFQQAGGAIPGMQAAFSNAVGARSGGNSAVQAALSQLMQQTVLAGQKQVADQQLQNQQIQAQAGGAIASATKNTQQTQKQGGILPELTAILGLVQGAKSLTGAKDIEDLGKKLGLGQGGRGATGGAPAPVTGPTAPVASAPQQNITGAAAPAMSVATGYDPTALLTGGSVPMSPPPMFNNSGQQIDPQVWLDLGIDPSIYGPGMSMDPNAAPSVNWNELGGGGGMSTNPGVTGGGFNMDYFNQPDYSDFIDYGEYF